VSAISGLSDSLNISRNFFLRRESRCSIAGILSPVILDISLSGVSSYLSHMRSLSIGGNFRCCSVNHRPRLDSLGFRRHLIELMGAILCPLEFAVHSRFRGPDIIERGPGDGNLHPFVERFIVGDFQAPEIRQSRSRSFSTTIWANR